MTLVKKSLTAGLAAVTLAGSLAASSAPAAAWGHRGWGGPFAAGVIGGLATGAIIGSVARPAYGYGYGYPAYGYGPEPVYDPCYVTRRPVYDGYGDFAGYRRVRVCN